MAEVTEGSDDEGPFWDVECYDGECDGVVDTFDNPDDADNYADEHEALHD